MPTGGAVKLTIYSDKTGYVRLPNGSILTTVDGVINTTYTGVGGRITYYVPKDSSVVNLINSGITGSLIYNGTSKFEMSENGVTGLTANNTDYLDLNGSSALSNLIAGEAVTCLTVGCALTAKSIGDILYSAYVANRENVNYNFTGYTYANVSAINYYLDDTYGVTFEGEVLDALVALGGTIILNP